MITTTANYPAAYMAVYRLTLAGELLWTYRPVGPSGFGSGSSKAIAVAGGAMYVMGNARTTAPPATVTQGGNGAGKDDIFLMKLVDGPLSISPGSATLVPGGSLTFTAVDGKPGYTFALSSNPSNGTLTGTATSMRKYTAGTGGGAAGATDTLKVTDALGNFATINITVKPALNVTASDASLFVNDTSTLTVAGGSGSGYALSSVAACGTVTTASATTFTYTATNASCVDTLHFTDSAGSDATVTISVGSALAITGATSPVPPKKVLNLGTTGQSGAVTWTYSGGSGGNITAGGVYTAGATGGTTDTITATDASSSTTATINVGPGITISSATSTAPQGTIPLSASGGSGTGFTWTVTTATPHGTIAGTTYTAGTTGLVSDTIKVTDSLGNVATGAIAITKAISLTQTVTNLPPRATATFTGHDGAGNFVYSIEAPIHGSIDPSTGVYTAGTTGNVDDTIRVTDKNSAFTTATIHTNAGVTLVSTSLNLAPGGTATLTASGGNGTFSNGNWSIVNNSGAAFTPAGTTASYKAGATGSTSDTITVKDTLGNASSVTISVGGGLVIDQGAAVTRPPLGTQTFTAHGGQTPYTWAFVGAPGSGAATIGSTTGAYKAGATGGSTDKVRVTDGNGTFADVTVTVSPGIVVTASPASLSVAPQAGISFGATGGSGSGYSWVIVKGSGGDASLGATTGAYKAGSTGNGVDKIVVTDSLGNTNSVNVTVGPPLALAASATHVPPRGAATFTATGGQTPYSFVVQAAGSGAATISSPGGAYKAGATPSVTDTIKVTDANGVTRTLDIAVDAGITIASATTSVAPNGTIAFSASGGSGTGFTWSVVAASGGSINPTTGAYSAGATAGKTDKVTVTDSLLNTASVNVSVGGGVTITPAGGTVPPRGTIEFSASGGTNAGFVWSMLAKPSGGNIVAATGAYTAGTTPNVTDKVHVQDSIGNGFDVDVVVSAALAIVPSVSSTTPRGAIDFSTTGGSGTGISYAMGLNGSGATVTIDGHYVAGSTGSANDSVVATDSLGNTATAAITIGAAMTVSPTAASVAPGAAQAFTASGGAGGYTFTFTANRSGGTLSSTGAYVAGHTPKVKDELELTDKAGATIAITVDVGEGLTLGIPASSAPVGGTISFTVSGGSGPFTWKITTNASGGTIDATTGVYKAGSTPGADTITVTDALGNAATVTVSVGGVLAITTPGAVIAPKGTRTFTATGGSGLYTWSLATNASGGSIDAAGAYVAGATGGVTDIVAVTDGTTTVTSNVDVGAGITVTPRATSAKPGDKVTFVAAGGSGTGYTWKLDANGSSGSIDAATGAYTAGATTGDDAITVTDSLGNVGHAGVAVTADGNAPPTPGGPTGEPTPTADAGTSLNPGLNLTPNAPNTSDDGCNATSSTPTSALPLLLALGLVAVRRRRRA